MRTCSSLIRLILNGKMFNFLSTREDLLLGFVLVILTQFTMLYLGLPLQPEAQGLTCVCLLPVCLIVCFVCHTFVGEFGAGWRFFLSGLCGHLGLPKWMLQSVAMVTLVLHTGAK